MPIRAIKLTRFRGFRSVRLPLRTLNVLVGPNSAGKSSFGHALVGLKQADALPGRRGVPDLAKPAREMPDSIWPVDLGTLKDLRTSGTNGSVGIGIETDAGLVEFEFGGNEDQGLELTRIRLPEPQRSAATIGAAPTEVPVAEPTGAGTEQTEPTGAVITVNIPIALSGEPLPPSVSGDHFSRDFRRVATNAWEDDSNTRVEVILQGLRVASVAVASTRSAVGYENGALNQGIEAIRKISYLRPNRARPQRLLERGREVEDVGYSGDLVVPFLREHGPDEVSVVDLPDRLPSTAEQAERMLGAHYESRPVSLLDAVAYFLRRLDLGAKLEVEDEEEGLSLRVARESEAQLRSLVDLGFGVSQILPVLVAGLTLKSEALLIVDLPEAHLHPKAEAALADFFCALALLGKQVLIETHSPALFDRLRVWAALNAELKGKIAVYFLNAPPEDGENPDPTELRLDDEGALHWPAGFLDEGLAGEKALRAVRAARKRAEP